MTRTLQRQRRSTNALPPAPRSLTDIVLNGDFVKLANGQQSLLYDAGPQDPERLIILGTKKNLEVLAACPHWFADGTFTVAPALYYQIYTLHVLQAGRVLPMLYCLLRRKTAATYTRVFRKILHLEPGLSPVTLLTDFEQAAIQAFRTVFPAAAPSACFFHLKQSVQRKVQESGLASLYSRDSRFREAVQLLPALAFLRPADIGRGKSRNATTLFTSID